MIKKADEKEIGPRLFHVNTGEVLSSCHHMLAFWQASNNTALLTRKHMKVCMTFVYSSIKFGIGLDFFLKNTCKLYALSIYARPDHQMSC